MVMSMKSNGESGGSGPRVRSTGVLIGILAGLVFLSAPALIAGESGGSAPSPMYQVYYFHGKLRCEFCLRIEAWAEQVVRTDFATQVAEGTLHWEAVDVDEPANEHYYADFALDNRTVILVETVAGKIERYHKADWVWDLVDGSEQEFKCGLRDDLRKFLNPEADQAASSPPKATKQEVPGDQ